MVPTIMLIASTAAFADNTTSKPLIHQPLSDTLPTTKTAQVVKGASDKITDTAAVFQMVETAARPKDAEAFRSYLGNNLKAKVPLKNKAPKGSYTVMIKFMIDVEGNITNLSPMTAHGYGMEEEAMRVLAKAPKWVPATQNGRLVKSYHSIPVTFNVE